MVYSVMALSLFAGLLLWCAMRLARLRGSCSGRAPVQRLIHGFCLAATVLRILYMVGESLVLHFRPRRKLWEKLLGIFYSSFFPLSAAAFLCICQYWLRIMTMVDESVSCLWCRNRLSVVWLGFILLEVLHDSWYALVAQPWWNAIYFLWLALVDVTVAIFGVNIARGLYQRVRALLTSASMSDESSQLFKQTLVSTIAVSVTSICFLGLSLMQALVGRFYAWPCLVCWAVGRLLEAVYLALVLGAVGRAREPAALNAGGSFAGGSFASAGRRTPPSDFEAFWITSSSSSFQECSGTQWPDNILAPNPPASVAAASYASS